MQSILLSASIVAPLFLMMLTGYILRLTKPLSQKTIDDINALLFTVFMPALVFINIYEMDVDVSKDAFAVLYGIAGSIASFGLAAAVAVLVEKEPSRRGAMMCSMYRSNNVMYGIALATSFFGNSGMGVCIVMISAVTPFTNSLGVLVFSLFGSQKPSLKSVLHSMYTNKIIQAIALAFVLRWLRVPLPGFLTSTLHSLGAVSTPMAFVLLGAAFSFKSAQHNRRSLVIASTVKLVIMPVIFVGLGALLGLRGSALIGALALFATPTGASTIPMASALGGDAELTGEIALFTTVLSLFTVFLSLLILDMGGLI